MKYRRAKARVKTRRKYLAYSLYGAVVAISCLGSMTVCADVIPGDQAVTNPVHTEHVVWNKIPISFVVPVGSERMISFPEPVVLHNSDSSLTTDMVSILNNGGTLYIKAKREFIMAVGGFWDLYLFIK